MAAKRIPPEYQRILDPFIKSGQLTVVNGRHPGVVAQNGMKQPIPSSASDHRSFLNWKGHFRKFAVRANLNINS